MGLLRKVLVLVLVVLIVGCTPKVEDYPITDKDFKKGTKGIEMELLKNGPPELVSEDTYFKVVSKLYNQGAYNTMAFVTLGIEQDFMQVVDSEGNPIEYSDVDKATLANIKEKRKELATATLKLSELQSKVQTTRVQEMDKLQEEIKTAEETRERILGEIKAMEGTLQVVSEHLTKSSNYLNGKSIYFPDGTFDEITFNVQAKKITALSEKHTTTVLVTACYQYFTELTQDICIDPDLYGTDRLDKVCRSRDYTFNDQGAPIAVTGIETKMVPHGPEKVKPQIIVKIKNKGKGNVISRDKVVEACSDSGLLRDDWNMVILDSLKLTYKDLKYVYGATDNDFECKVHPIRLEGNEGEVRCTLLDDHAMDKSDIAAFTTQLNVRLSYGYTFSVGREVVIENPDAY
jgi:hypothetical protein